MSDTGLQAGSELSERGAAPVGTAAEREQVRLIDLYLIFASRMGLMAAVFAVCVVAAVFFLWWIDPLYRAQVYLLAPLPQDVILRDERGVSVASMQLTQDVAGEAGKSASEFLISSMPADNLKFQDYTPERVYEEFLTNLQSRQLRREFFDSFGVYDAYVRVIGEDAWLPDRMFEKRFHADLKVEPPDEEGDGSFAMISFEFEDPDYAAEVLNGFVEAVDRHTIEQLYDVVGVSLRGQIQGIEDEIAIRRAQALAIIDDQIARLTESANVARALGLVEGTEPLTRRSATDGLVVNTVESPDYLRGEKALLAEIAAYEARKKSDAFVPGLRQLETRLEFLSGIRLSMETLRSARIDQRAHVPDEPVFPRPAVTLALASIAGVMLALFAALVHHGWGRMREELPNDR